MPRWLEIIIDKLNSPLERTPDSERTKPFRLVKYFSLSSLALIFCGTIILSWFNTHWIRSMQYKKSEAYALQLIEHLNHQVFLQFILPMGLKFRKIELRNQEQYELIDRVVRNTMHGFNVELINMYDAGKDIVAYSYASENKGMKNSGGPAYFAAREGRPTSKYIQTGSFWELFFGIPKTIKIKTFAPLRAEKPLDPVVLTVVEIVQDLSNEYQSLFRFQILTLITVSSVMSVLFVLMTVVVKRGEGIIKKRALEQLNLKEQLSQAKHFSALGEMIAGISHEIRNPLGIISSSAGLLQKKIPDDDPLQNFPSIIIEESMRLNNIITDFLNYAKPQPPDMLACRIEDVIDKNIRFLFSQTEKIGVDVLTHFDDDLPIIRADADMLYQAFLNILINAMQAMPDGGTIDIWAKAGKSNLWIVFEDQGPGVPKDIMEKIWDPFFTTKDKGTGLGLGIVKKMMEAHHGQIRIDNRPEGGARISIRLPVYES